MINIKISKKIFNQILKKYFQMNKKLLKKEEDLKEVKIKKKKTKMVKNDNIV